MNSPAWVSISSRDGLLRASESLCDWAICGPSQPHTLCISAQATKQTSVTVLNNRVCLFFGVYEGPGEGAVQCYDAVVPLRHKKESNSVDKRDY